MEKLKKLNFCSSGQSLREVKAGVLSGILSNKLTLTLYNTSVQTLPPEVFSRIGKSVRDISVDVTKDNHNFHELSNPNSAWKPNLPRKVFLDSLKLSGSPWVCNCEIGWVETWLRKRRQYQCLEKLQEDIDEQEKDLYHMDSIDDPCGPVGDDLREAACNNRNNQSVLEILKTDLECGWSGSTNVLPINFIILALLALLLREVPI